VPGEDVGSAANAGAVVVLVGPTLHALLTQGGPATAGGLLPGATESGDQFGAALATGDFDGDNADNLVIGVPGENLGTVADAGAVISLCGNEGLMAGCPDGVLTQANPETGDAYGAALTGGNFDGNEFPDLAVGAPGETVAGAGAAGAADARDGELGGLPAGPDAPLYFQSSDGVPGSAEAGDLFAAALAARPGQRPGLRPRTTPPPRPGGAAPARGAGPGPARSAGRSRSRPGAGRRRRPPSGPAT
jgi:hypothetical protein